MTEFEAGTQINGVTVLGRAGRSDSTGVLWRIRCECGKEMERPAGRIRKLKSCGCRNKWYGHQKVERQAKPHTLAVPNPDVRKPEFSRRTIEIGTAGEHLVCADLLLSGYRAFLSSQGLPYDVIVDVGCRLLRVAVKATVGPTRKKREGREAYFFAIARRSSHKGIGRIANYTPDDADIVALVALDVRRVAYLHIGEVKTSVQLAADHGASCTNRMGPKCGVRKRIENLTFAKAAWPFIGGVDGNG